MKKFEEYYGYEMPKFMNDDVKQFRWREALKTLADCSKTLKEININPQVRVGCIYRGNCYEFATSETKLMVGDIVTLTGMAKGAEGEWTNKNDKAVAPALESIYDLTFDQIFGWLETKPIKVKEIVDEVFGENFIVDFVDIFAEVSFAKRSSGLASVKIGNALLPAIVGDVLTVTVGEILDWTGKKGNEMINAIVSGICDDTTFGQYIKDIAPAKEGKEHVIETEVFKNIENKAYYIVKITSIKLNKSIAFFKIMVYNNNEKIGIRKV